MTRPALPRRVRVHRAAAWTPPAGWARPTPAVLRAVEAALARWSA
ncbi:hypothetical protein [Streptomyces sp. NPDC005423]